MSADTTERLLRGLYSTVLYLLVPVTVYHLIWRGFRQEAYLERWSERYARYGAPAGSTPVWVHAVSVGEVNAVAPLVNALLEAAPRRRLLVTTITPTGSARVRALWGERVEHVYLPYDLGGAVRRFLAHFRPRIALVVETELWPNLLFCCRDAGIPAYLVNARLSERSLRGYRMLRPLLSRALATMRRIAAQSGDDARRFGELGAPEASLAVTGNLKYDIAIDVDALAQAARGFRERIGGRMVWIAASTHPEEEAAVLEIHRRLRERWPDLLMLWAPRHPERFGAVAQRAVDAGWRVATRRLTQWPDVEDAVFVLDTLGELQQFYACADAAFVGGSLQDIGGHNLLEPAAVGTPVVSGPHLHNFADIARQMQARGALRVGQDADAICRELAALLDDPAARQAMAEAGLVLVREGRGALLRTLDVIGPDLPGA
jgi:3-deoxy-D-manno-octulosonic-acid transferase